MAKRKPPEAQPPTEEARRPGRTGEPLNVYVQPAIMAVLREYLARTTPRTTKTAVIELALREFFQRREVPIPGFDPLPDQAGSKGAET